MGKNMILSRWNCQKWENEEMKKLKKIVSKAQHHCPKRNANFSATFEGVHIVQIECRIAHWKLTMSSL